MDLKQITYFIAVAEKGSISAAAAHIRIAQPALSAQIANLEADMGVNLFSRHGRGVTLTAAGATFLTHAHKMVADIAIARRATIDAAGVPAGEVTVGLPMTTANLLTVPIVDAVRKRFPSIDLRIVDGMSGDILGWLIEGRLDVAIIYDSGRPVPLPATPLVDDDLYLIGHENSFTRGRTEVTFRDLSRFPLFHTSPAHSLRQLLDHLARQLGVPLTYAAEIDSIPQTKALVYRGRGYTILPKIALGDDKLSRKMRLLRLVEPNLKLRSLLATAPRRAPSRAVSEVFGLIPDVAANLLARRRWPGGHASELLKRH
jgi:LysR family transcriptional regulator, nitrogen assimilation regulatory protein